MAFFNIPVFIPHLACPFQCVFCNQNKISGKVHVPDFKEISDNIDRHLTTIDLINNHVEIAFFGGSFTCLAEDQQKKYLSLAMKYIEAGKVHGIRISTRPDYISESNLLMLKDFGVRTIEIGAQSMDYEVLNASGRGHLPDDVVSSSGLIKHFGFNLGLQLMVGLPLDTKEKTLKTAETIADLSPDFVRIYPVIVIKNTELERLYFMGLYRPLSLVEAVDWIVPVTELFIKRSINIIRVGLHPSECLLNGDALVAGPFHSSFRELVMTKIWGKRLEGIKVCGSDITIIVSDKEYNNAIGYKARNKKNLSERFKRVKFEKSDELSKTEFHVYYR